MERHEKSHNGGERTRNADREMREEAGLEGERKGLGRGRGRLGRKVFACWCLALPCCCYFVRGVDED